MHRAAIVLMILCACDCERLEPPTLDDSSPAAHWRGQRIVECSLVEQAQAAVQWWQSWLCAEAVRCAGPLDEWNVYVSYTMPLGVMSDVAGDADASTYWEPETQRVWVWIREPGTIDVEFRLVAHELGHALGLAHDPGSRLSVMAYPTPVGNTLLVQHEDLEALGELCHGRQ